MKIALMCHSSYGGSPRIAIDSAMELSRSGHDIHLFTRTPPYMLPSDTNGIYCNFIYNSNDKTDHPARLKTNWSADELEKTSNSIITTVINQGIDIIHVHYALPFIFIVKTVKEKLRDKTPAVILTLHGTDVTRLTEMFPDRDMLAEILSCCDAVTTVSSSHAELFTRLSCLDIKPEIIPNFTDTSRFQPKNTSCPGIKPVMIHVSNFREIKNPCAVVEVFYQLRKKIEAQLWLVGDGQEIDNVKEFADKKQVLKDIKFYGLQPDVSKLITKSDMLVMTSVYESFCLTALESMACGVPVLAPKVGGLPEVLEHGRTGFLFQPGKYDDAVEFTAKLFSNPEHYAQISTNCLRRAHLFEQKKIVPLYEKLYKRIISKKNSVGRNHEGIF